MKKIISIILAIALVIGLCNVIPGTATNVKAETGEEVWTELGNNDALTWQTASSDLEAQTIQFAKSVKVTKLRLYVTETYGGANYTIREFEAYDKNGTNQACPTLWTSNVTVTSTLTDVNTGQLGNICNGNGGARGFDSGSSGWDSFSHSASTTEYIEFAFKDGEVELSSVSLWATWCYNAAEGWGNAPKKWKVEGVVVEEPEPQDEFVELGNNDGLTWATDTSSLESQTIEFDRAVKVKKLRLYVTELSKSSTMLREIETLDSNGVNKASSRLWGSNVTITTNITDVNTGQLANLCNGNGGQSGFDGTSSSWDQFVQSKASDTEYVELDFGENAVEVASVRIWATWCGSNAPKKWKVTGLVDEVATEGLTFLGNNSSLSWASTASANFENQEIVFDNPVTLTKLRLKVTDTYGLSYKISEFEAFNTDGVNVLASVTTDYASDASAGQQSLTSDGKKRSSLATITFAEGMTTNFADSMVNGENFSNDNHWYKRTIASKDDLVNEYIDFEFDRPYTIQSVKMWSNWCCGGSWGDAAKSWEVYGQKATQKIENALSDSSKWSGKTGFQIGSGTAVPASSGESVMYAGELDLNAYRVEAEISASAGQFGLITHYTDANKYYKAVIDKTTDKVILYKGTTQVAEKYWSLENNTVLAITVNGEKVSVWADEVKMMDYTDSTALKSGKYGLYAKDAIGSYTRVTIAPIDVPDTLPADYPYEPTAKKITEELSNGDFYVAENGDDNNNGTSIDTPFRTLKKAQAAVKVAKATNPNKDYVIILRGGTYYLDETLTMNAEDGGTGNYRVTYAAYPNETPIISGGKKVTSAWTQYDGKAGVYVTTLPDEFKDVDIRQMFVADVRATRSREPDIGETANKVTETGYWNVGAIASDYTWLSPEGTMPEEWASLSNTGVEYHGRANWRYYRQEVADFDVVNNKITVTSGTIGVRHGGVNVSVALKDWVYFENALLFVDTPGEWYYDKTTNQLYYYPENGENPNELNITIPCLEKLIDMTGTQNVPVENLDFVGLRFSHTTWSMPDCGRIGGQAGRYSIYLNNEDKVTTYTTPVSAVYLKYAEKINIQDCDFTMLGEGAVNMEEGAHSNRVDGCTFTDVGAHGVFIGHEGQTHQMETSEYDSTDVPRGNAVVNNYMNHCGTTERGTVPILGTFLNHTLIENNTVIHMTYSGISLGWRWDTDVYSSHHNQMNGNYVSDVMTQLHDGAGVYVLGSQYGNCMYDNYVRDVKAGSPNSTGVNIYFDEGTRYTYYDGNYMADMDIYYHMCSYDELKALYAGTNYPKAEPEDASIYGYLEGEAGDANYDGVVDVRDVIRLKKYQKNATVKIDKVVSDFDEDGLINNSDCISLKRSLIEPKVVSERSYNGQEGYTDIKTLELQDYLKAEILTTSSAVNQNKVSGLCDNDYGNGYESSGMPVLPDEFVFNFENAIIEKTVLQLVANYAKDQGPAKLDVFVQKGTEEWEQIGKYNLNWDSAVNNGQSIKIPLDTVGVTALKVIVKEANTTWSKYIISEMDLYVPNEMSNYNLVFADEFDGTSVDSGKWLTQYFPHSTNDAEACQTTYRMEDGKLCLYIDGNTKQFSDATTMKVSSLQTFEKSGLHSNTADVREVEKYESFACQYGYFEMRAKLPNCGGGGHVAWWLVGTEDDRASGSTTTTQNGEIDIVETMLAYPNMYSPKIHPWSDTNLTEYKQNIGLSGDFANEYHVYAMDWRPEGITFYVDGKEVATTTHSPDYRMAMFLGIYTDSDPESFSGVDNRVYPKEFYVDYVRVYQDRNGYTEL